IRPLTGGALSIGQTVKVDLDQGFQDTGSTVGFALQNSASQNLAEVYYVGGDSVNSWKKNDAAGQSDLSPNIGFSGDGFHLELTLTTATTYSGVLTRNSDALSAAFNGTLITPGTGTQDITQLRLFNFNSGGGDNANFYGNSLVVTTAPIPEPATILLVGPTLLGGWFFIRRRRA